MTQNPLEELQPITLPADPGIWPFAIGWWLLSVALISLLIVVTVSILKHRRYWAVRRQNLLRVKNMTDQVQLNRALKQVALHYYPAHRVARLNGDSWASFLNQGLTPEHHVKCHEICTSLYQKPSLAQDSCYQKIAIAWLSGLSRKQIEAAYDA